MDVRGAALMEQSSSFLPFGAPPSDLSAGLSGFKFDGSDLRVRGAPPIRRTEARAPGGGGGGVPLAQAGALRGGALRIAAGDVRPPEKFSGSANRHLEKVGASPRLWLWRVGGPALMFSALRQRSKPRVLRVGHIFGAWGRIHR